MQTTSTAVCELMLLLRQLDNVGRNYIRLSCGLPWTQTIDRAIEKLDRLVSEMSRAVAT